MGELLASSPAEDAVDGFAGTQRRRCGWPPTPTSPRCPPPPRAVPDVADAFAVQVLGEEAPVADPAVARQAIRDADAAAAPRRRRRPGARPRKGASTVRVDAERLDQLMHYMGELVLHRTQVEALAAGADVPGLSQAMQSLTRDLPRAAGDGHAGPDDPGRGRLPALPAPGPRPADQARQGGPPAAGRRRTPSSTAPSSTRSATRSCTSCATRSTTGSSRRRSASPPASPPTGVLEISARHAGGNVVITVRDDGRGIDPERVARKAAERGLITAEQIAGDRRRRAPPSCSSTPASPPPT